MFSTPSRQTSGEMDMSLGGGITMSLTNCFCIFAEAASTFYRVSYVCVCSQRQPRIAPSAVALDVRVAARVCLAEFRMSHLLMLVWSTHACMQACWEKSTALLFARESKDIERELERTRQHGCATREIICAIWCSIGRKAPPPGETARCWPRREKERCRRG